MDKKQKQRSQMFDSSKHVNSGFDEDSIILGLEKIFRDIDRDLKTEDFEIAINSILQKILDFFRADRCFLLTPCELGATYWSIPYEVTVPEHPTMNVLGTKYPMTEEIKQLTAETLKNDDVVIFERDKISDFFASIMDQFDYKSKMMRALHTSHGESWVLGIHQCSHIRRWTSLEKSTFNLFCSRMSDWLSLHQAVIERSEFIGSLKAAEKYYRGVFENSGTAMLIYGSDGIILEVNPKFEQLCGYTREEIEGKIHWKTFVTDEEREKMLKFHQMRDEKSGNPPSAYEFNFFDRYENVKPVSMTLDMIKGTDKRIISLIDLTNIRRVEAEKSRLIDILESTSDMVSTATSDGIITYINKAGRDLVGISQDDSLENILISDLHPKWATEIIYDAGLIAATESGTWTGENAIWDGQGKEVPISQVITAHRNQKNELEYLSTVIRDISKAKEVQKNLNDSLKKYYSLFDSVSDAIFILEDGIFTECNKSTLGMFDAEKRAQIIGKPPFEFSPEYQPDGMDSATKAKQKIQSALDGHPQVFYWRHKTLTDKQFDTEVSLNRLFLDGKPHLIAIVRDITEKRQAEETLKQSEEKYRLMAENASDCIWKMDIESETFTYISPGIKQITGFDAEEVVGSNLRRVLPLKDYKRVKEILDFEITKILESGKDSDRKISMEIRHFHRDRKYVWTEFTASFARDKNGEISEILGVSREIEERKRAETALREREELFRTVITSSNDAIISVNQLGRITIFNHAAEKMFGYKQKEMIGSTLDILMPDEFKKNHQNNVMSYFRTGYPNNAIGYTLELPAVRKSGEQFPMDLTLSVGVVEGKNFVFANIRDISERKKAERDLRESEERFRSLHRASFGGICIIADDIVLEANQGLTDITGYQYAELIGNPASNLIVKTHRKEFFDKIGKQEHRVFELIGLKKDESTYPAEIRSKQIPYKDKIAIIIELRDITSRKEAESEKRELENQLQQSQKMEAIGRLAGGVAHDFNNLLTAISGNAEIGMLSMDEDDPQKVYFAEITSTADRAAELTKRLLAFSRKQKLQPKITNLNNLITGMGKMLSRIIEENVECITELDQSLWPVKVDPGQIEQVILNLAINARDAIGGMGKITISTKNVSVENQLCLITNSTFSGEHVLVSVKDDGIGIEPSKIKKIFEPFYTTKEIGRGTGLGLSMVQGIVDQSDGHIMVKSIPGVGTTFNIFFHPVNLDEIVNKEIAESNLDDYRGKEFVMVVEDEEVVREMIKKILDNLGYESTFADSPDSALRQFKSMQKKPDAIISDVIMPKMSGPILVEKMLAIEPELKYMFMSGYFSEGINQETLIQATHNFLQKPFKPLDLAKTLRKIIES